MKLAGVTGAILTVGLAGAVFAHSGATGVVKQRMDSMAAIEKFIKNYAKKAQDGKLTMAEMKGGTFTITNGGTYGSMLSTPIINPPQTAILGMHNIVERPVVIEGEIMIRPMMYLALSYDHRIIDGAEAVQFLVMVKEMLESPTRMLLEI